MRRAVIAIAVVGLLLGASTRAAAQAPADVASAAVDEEARALFQAGLAHFKAGRYQAAFRLFSEAYELSQRRELLYNVGLAADKAGKTDLALSGYHGYIAWDPDGEKSAEVKARIKTLEAWKNKLASPAEAAASAAGDRSADGPAEKPSWHRWAWGGGAGVAVALIVVLVATSAANRDTGDPLPPTTLTPPIRTLRGVSW